MSHLYHTLSNWLPHTFGLERNPHPRCQAHHAKTCQATAFVPFRLPVHSTHCWCFPLKPPELSCWVLFLLPVSQRPWWAWIYWARHHSSIHSPGLGFAVSNTAVSRPISQVALRRTSESDSRPNPQGWREGWTLQSVSPAVLAKWSRSFLNPH